MKRLFCLLFCLMMLMGTAIAEDDGLPFAIRNGDRNQRYIAITVDDCYRIEWAQKIYDLCKQYDIGLTFFPLGDQLKPSKAEFWKKVAADPKVEIGSHTQHHATWANLKRVTIETHVYRVQECLDELLGYHYQIQALRPPFGRHTSNRASWIHVHNTLARYGFNHVVLWDVSQTNPDKAIKQVQNGSILLYHTKHKDYECLVKLIPMLLEAGYIPVTVSELLGFGDIATSTDIYVHQKN